MASYTESPDEGRGRRNLAIAVTFLVLSVVVLYLPPRAQWGIAAGFRATLLRPFIFTQESLARARLRAEEAGRLQAQLDSLAATLAGQAHLVDESRRLHELLDLRERAPEAFVPASVIRAGTAGSESMFLLDKGYSAGIRPGNPVIMRGGRIGLVGLVREVRRGTAIGIDWTHPDFRASAMSSDGRVFGIVEPRRGAFREEDRLLLNGTPFYERLEPGTPILASGLGGVYPRGIPIGWVVELAEQEGRWRKGYWLRPAVEVGSVTHVLVVVAEEIPGELLEELQGSDPLADPGGERPGGAREPDLAAPAADSGVGGGPGGRP
jgi:rod shape-determining protein MreC